MSEIWKQINGYGSYQVSSMGRVRNSKTGRVHSCISEATKETKIGHIRQVIAGERATAGGYRWERA